MKNVETFLNRLALEKEADKLLKASYNTDEKSMQEIANNKSNKYASGKLTEYKRLLNTCKFKLVVYFGTDKWGRQFTLEEKKQNLHRRFIPSVDRVRETINEELGLNTLIDYCLQNQNRIDAAQIILIDRIGGEEIQIFKFNAKNISASQFVQMEFKKNDYGNTHFIKLLETPLRVDKIRNYENKNSI